jgi:hypothetical protein
MAEKIFTKLTEVDFSAITAGYTPIVLSDFPIYQITIINLTDAPLLFSLDGATDGIYVLGSSGGGPYFNIPFGINVAFPSTFYMKYQTPPSMGQVFFEAFGNNGAAYATETWR